MADFFAVKSGGMGGFLEGGAGMMFVGHIGEGKGDRGRFVGFESLIV